MRLTGSVSLVTGAASGLGRATASRLVSEGSRVVLVDLPTSAGAAVATELGPDAVFAPADVRDPDEVAAAVAAAAELGDLRVVVTCAGISQPARTVGRRGPADLDTFRRVVEVNLVGTYNAVRLGAAQMATTDPVDGERGVIVTTSSVAAFDGQVGQASYAASKAGVAGMTLPVARDLAGLLVRVVSVAPGIFDTPMLAGMPDDVRSSLAAQVPHPARLGRPEEYADLVAHVIGNPMLNGEVVRLDGAIRMGPR